MLVLALIPAALIAWWSSGQDALMENQVDRGERMIFAVDLRIFLVTAVVIRRRYIPGNAGCGWKSDFPPQSFRFVGLCHTYILNCYHTGFSLNFISSKSPLLASG